jgi:hypothetical protein
MVVRMSLLLLACALALAGPANGKVEHPTYNRRTGLFEPSFGELERAVERGDRAEVARWAARIGPARLAEALRASERARVVAALEAIGLLPGNVRLLEAVSPLVASAEAPVAERAVRVLGQLLDATEPRRLEEWDVPADAVARACRALADVAARAAAPAELRLGAIDALADATFACRPVALGPLLSDPQPAIRRAALLAQRARDEIPSTLLRQALADPDPGVVSALAVAWCRHRLLAGPRATTAADLARLPAGPSGGGNPTPPLRELAAAESTPVEDALELVPCLAVSSDPADRHALEQLRKAKSPLLRARAGELAAGGH